MWHHARLNTPHGPHSAAQARTLDAKIRRGWITPMFVFVQWGRGLVGEKVSATIDPSGRGAHQFISAVDTWPNAFPEHRSSGVQPLSHAVPLRTP